MDIFSSKIKPLIISFYAEKGGVGKTTTCLNLAYFLAKNGKKVLIYDCDPQRSLTAWIFGNIIENNFDGDVNSFISSSQNEIFLNNPKTLYEQMMEYDLRPAEVKIVLNNPNLMIVPGDYRTNLLDLGIYSDESSNSIGIGIANMTNETTGKPYHAIIKTAQENGVDFVFLDLNPYSGVLNRCLLMSSHYFILPCIPDFFSLEMMKNMVTLLKKWNLEIDKKIKSTKKGRFPFPDYKPKYLGYIISRFHPCRKGVIEDGLLNDHVSTKDIKWFKKMVDQSSILSQELSESNSLVGENKINVSYKLNLAVKKEIYNLANRTSTLGFIREYRSLKSASDQIHIPVCFLTNDDVRGKNYEDGSEIKLTSDDNIRLKEFKLIYGEILKNIFQIIQQDQNNIV